MSLLAFAFLFAAPPIRTGAVFHRSASIPKGVYRLSPLSIATDDKPGPGCVFVRGNHIVLDFHGATLEGSDPRVEPNLRRGTGIEVRGNDVTIENLKVRGFKVGLIARHCSQLKLVGCDFSYNWKQHLGSTIEKEDESDWQSYHHNENEEWLRYGAGAYLQDCEHPEVRNCRATGGQCGLMLCRTNHGLIWNNDFSFLSGVGLGLYRSSFNAVENNNIDWCVRGFSYGVYNRGQDSAGILIFEQSSHNLFAYNSVTHGGDGFFLWAGQTTMDTGKGGCNDNYLYGNDFSHAPTNGIEATFSRNLFANNLVAECDNGFWGGYSYDTAAIGNRFAGCNVGVAIEHGQNIRLVSNAFDDSRSGVRLWANPVQDPSWGYPKNHETRSMGYTIQNNRFSVAGTALSIRQTEGIRLDGNHGEAARAFDIEPPVPTDGNPIGHAAPVWPSNAREYPRDIAALIKKEDWSPFGPVDGAKAPSRLQGGRNPFLPPGALRGRRYILVDEWGPYDFRSPKLWPRTPGHPLSSRSSDERIQMFEVLGPMGRFKVTGVKGGHVIGPTSGSVPGWLVVGLPKGRATKFKISLDYVGAATTDYRGVVTPAGKKVGFGYSQFFAPIDWKLKFFQWDKSTDPRTEPSAFAQLLQGQPLATVTADAIDYNSGGSWAPGVPGDYFAISADGSFTIDPGDYTFELVTDDGARASLDGAPLQLYDESGKPADAFKYQGATRYTAKLHLDGKPHVLHVDYFQIDGGKTLQVRIKPA